MLVAFVEFEVAASFLRGPAEDQGQIVDEARLRKLFQ